MKFCNGCVTIKPSSDFSPDRRAASGLQSRCRICCARWQNENPLFRREGQLRRKYGIDHGTYLELLSSQGGLCAICKSSDPGRSKQDYFAVDHDHSTGKVRGLLCDWCNKALGQFKENVDSLENAITYLKSHGK